MQPGMLSDGPRGRVDSVVNMAADSRTARQFGYGEKPKIPVRGAI